MRRGCVLSPFRSGRPGPNVVALAPACQDSPRGVLVRSHCPTPGPRTPVTDREQVAAVQLAWRSDSAAATVGSGDHLLTGAGLAGVICGRAGLVLATPHPFPGPNSQPSAKCLPSANKGRTPAPSPPAPTSESGGRMRQSKWVFCAQTLGPRSLHPTSFASSFDIC